jgi:hypothetical protein
MPLWRSLWEDESGAIVSAEMVAVSTVAVLSGTVGMNMLASSVDGELREMAHAVRSFDQSYAVAGHVSSRAWTAGSAYTQPDVKESLRKLDLIGDQPNVPAEKPRKPAKKAPQKAKKKVQKQDADEQDDLTFVVPDESSLQQPDPVEAEDDASKVETVIEPAPEA